MTEVGEGRCVVEVPYSDGLAQQQRYFHGAVAGAIADSAGGEAGGSGGGTVRRSQVVRLRGRGLAESAQHVVSPDGRPLVAAVVGIETDQAA
jgi:acyl-coenzyme A thioesterase PaaI-like protein